MVINYEVITKHVKSMAGEDKSLIPVVAELKENFTGKSLIQYDWRGEERKNNWLFAA